MLAQEALEGEDAGATVLAGAGGAAELGDRPGALVEGVRHLLVVDDFAVADNHIARVRQALPIGKCGLGLA